MYHKAREEVRGQLEIVGSLLPSCGAQDPTCYQVWQKVLSSVGPSHQAWPHTPAPAEPSHLLCVKCSFGICSHSFWRQGLTLAKANLEFEFRVVFLPLSPQCENYRAVSPGLLMWCWEPNPELLHTWEASSHLHRLGYYLATCVHSHLNIFKSLSVISAFNQLRKQGPED